EAVADYGRGESIGERQHSQQLGFGACLKAEVEGPAKVEDFLDHVSLLVHLDGIDAAVFSLVAELLNGGPEGVVDFADAVSENVGEAEENRQLNAAGLQLIDELFQIDRLV